jgi:hypothetical protein
MVASVIQIRSPLNFISNQILVVSAVPKIFTVPHFKRIYLLSLCYDLALNLSNTFHNIFLSLCLYGTLHISEIVIKSGLV